MIKSKSSLCYIWTLYGCPTDLEYQADYYIVFGFYSANYYSEERVLLAYARRFTYNKIVDIMKGEIK